MFPPCMKRTDEIIRSLSWLGAFDHVVIRWVRNVVKILVASVEAQGTKLSHDSWRSDHPRKKNAQNRNYVLYRKNEMRYRLNFNYR